jgi:hypothetical protein
MEGHATRANCATYLIQRRYGKTIWKGIQRGPIVIRTWYKTLWKDNMEGHTTRANPDTYWIQRRYGAAATRAAGYPSTGCTQALMRWSPEKQSVVAVGLPKGRLLLTARRKGGRHFARRKTKSTFVEHNERHLHVRLARAIYIYIWCIYLRYSWQGI